MPNHNSPGVYVTEVKSGSAPIAGVGTSTACFIGLGPDGVTTGTTSSTSFKGPVLVTNFTEFLAGFDQSWPAPSVKSAPTTTTSPAGDTGHPASATTTQQSPTNTMRYVANAVRGFLSNGGTRCYVVQIATTNDLEKALDSLEALDDISIIAAPGLTDKATRVALTGHAAKVMDRVAVLDTSETIDDFATSLAEKSQSLPGVSEYTALYFPWIQVSDAIDGSLTFVPPSGHIAGVYARVDAQRGVHKAPANEPIYGALDLKYAISTAKQDGLNPHGVNCIRRLNGAIQIWGARTVGGDANGEFKYISTRRLFNYLRESIKRGTQWAVFEPNDTNLWAKLTRNISAFLTQVWEAGALFGSTPQDAFYVQCNAETNPLANRELGKVTAKIGVAITKPAEFVEFELGQWAGNGK